MRRITAWRWIFGLALVPAALLIRADFAAARGAGPGEWIAAGAMAFLLGLAMSALVVGFAVWAYFAARSAAGFMAELLGLRG